MAYFKCVDVSLKALIFFRILDIVFFWQVISSSADKRKVIQFQLNLTDRWSQKIHSTTMFDHTTDE